MLLINKVKSHKSVIKISPATLRGFHTNVGEPTYQFVIKAGADIVFI